MNPLLSLELDLPLPAEVAVGTGTAVFLAGRLRGPDDAPVADLELLVDGRPQPILHHGLPRRDGSCGFWTLARLARGEGPVRLMLRARLSDGRPAEAEVGEIARRGDYAPIPPSPLHGADAAAPLVAICLATHNPPAELLRRQLRSIRAQTHPRWLCLISDDASDEDHFAALREAVAGDPRFVLSRSPRRLGLLGNFERALALAPAETKYVALCDQDDHWHPHKLATLLGAIGDAQLVYSDARVVGRDGGVLAESWWTRRANNHTDPLSLLVANSVSGAASLFRRDLLDTALPFPPGQFPHFHDHWVALVGLASGEIRYVPEPLYDYVQHAQATQGHAAATGMTGLGARLRHPRGLTRRLTLWRWHYFADACRLLTLATILELRCGPGMDPRMHRALARFLAADRGDPRVLARLAARGLRELGRRRPETLGMEWMLFCAFLWRQLAEAAGRRREAPPPALEAVIPDRWARARAP